MAQSNLSTGITLDQIDAYFSIGKPVPKSQTVPGLVFQGRPLDTVTKQPMKIQEEYTYLSRYKRGRSHLIANGGPSSVGVTTTYDGEESSQFNSSIAGGDMQQLELDTLPDLACLSINVADHNNDPSHLEVYSHYNFKHRYDETLPVFQHKEEILSTIENNRVTIIQGSTGSGKTTQVPQFILDGYQANNKYCNIVVTQPRKIAAMSIARRVCHERNWQVGQLVGYQVGLDKVTSEDTRITYMTVGVLLRQIVKQKHMKNYTHVILDEVHERDQETDFALLVVRRLLHLNSESVKVVLMSATFETDKFARYFQQPVMDLAEIAPVVTVEGRVYEVTEHFVEELVCFGPLPVLDATDPDISDEAFTLAVKLIKHFDSLEIEERPSSSSNGSLLPISRGTVLIFLPGIFYIRELEQLLEYSRVDSRLTIVPLHSSITLEEQSQVFAPPKPGMRKVILSTNIAESSITVPDIKYVIDFCLTKSLLCDPDTNYQSLRLQWASKANAIQRKGRAGRISNGQVYRLVSKEFWEKSMSEYGVPEMQRCPLEHIILQVKLLDLGEPKAILSLAMTPPALENIEGTILLLKEVGALSTVGRTCRQRHDGDLTFVGKVLAALPLDMRLGKLLLLGYVFGCLENCIVIAAALSRGSFLATPYRQNLEAFRYRLRWASGSFSDCICYLKAYRAWEHAVNTQMFRRKRDEYIWCRKNYIEARRIHEVHMLVKELTDRLRNFNIRSADQDYWQKDSYEDCELILKVAMAGAFYPNYFFSTQPDEKPALKEICELDPRRTVMLNGLPLDKGPLYSDSLQFAMKDCGKQKAIYFDGSKAFVEFCEEADSEVYTGNILPSVYVACKMRNARRKLQIVQSNSETPKSWKLLKQPFLYDSINASSFKKEIPKPGGSVWITIHVTHVLAANHFWGCKASEPFFSIQQKLFKDIQDAARTAEPFSSTVDSDTLVLAPYSDGTGTWYYRGLIQHCVGSKVKIFFVDYGNSGSNINVSRLKKIPQHVADVPFQAVEFELKYVRMLESVSREGGKKYLEDLLIQSENRCNVKVYSVVSGRTRVDLFTLDDLHVNDHLVQNELAEMCEESRLSEKSHGEWELAEYNNVKSEEEFKTINTAGWRPVPSDARGPLIPHTQRRNPVSLFGPKNPFETSFYSMISIGQMRNVRVDRDGVNSVVINQDATDEHKDLMVAACVGVNESGGTMLARNTTLLPKIHGLPYIISMLFTPVLELRCDKHRMRLTGAICGLGAMKTRVGTLSILPEHDMELQFDVKISIDDIIGINSLRMKINMTVGSSEEIASWSQSAIHRIQKKSRSELLKLLHKQRPSVIPESFRRPYKWDQVDPHFIVPHDVAHHSADRKDLYRLHDAMILNDPSAVEDL